MPRAAARSRAVALAPLELIHDLLGHANVNTTKLVYAAYEQRTLLKGFEKFNPSASQAGRRARGRARAAKGNRLMQLVQTLTARAWRSLWPRSPSWRLNRKCQAHIRRHSPGWTPIAHSWPPAFPISRPAAARPTRGTLRSPRTGATYRDGMLRFDHFLTQAGVDPFTMTADAAQLPEDVLEHFFRWLARVRL